MIARAEGESFRFEQLLAEYQRAPSVTRQRLYIDAIEDVLSNTSKVLVDVEGGNNMMFLPLDRLMSGSMDSATGEQQSGRLQLNSQQLRDLADQVTRELNAQAASSDRSRVQNLPVRR